MQRWVTFVVLVLASCGASNVAIPKPDSRADTDHGSPSSSVLRVLPQSTGPAARSSAPAPRTPHPLVATRVEGVPEDLVRDAIGIDCVAGEAMPVRSIAILKRRTLSTGSLVQAANVKWSPSKIYPLPLRSPRPRDPIAWFETAITLSAAGSQTISTTIFSSESGAFRWDRRSAPQPTQDPPTANGWQLGSVDAISTALLANTHRVYETWRARRSAAPNQAPEVAFEHRDPRTIDLPSVPPELGVPGTAIAIGDLNEDGAIDFAFSNNSLPTPSRRSNPRANELGPDTLTIVTMPELGTKGAPQPKQWIRTFSFPTTAVIHAIGICQLENPSTVLDTEPGLVFVAGHDLWWVR